MIGFICGIVLIVASLIAILSNSKPEKKRPMPMPVDTNPHEKLYEEYKDRYRKERDKNIELEYEVRDLKSLLQQKDIEIKELTKIPQVRTQSKSEDRPAGYREPK